MSRSATTDAKRRKAKKQAELDHKRLIEKTWRLRRLEIHDAKRAFNRGNTRLAQDWLEQFHLDNKRGVKTLYIKDES